MNNWYWILIFPSPAAPFVISVADEEDNYENITLEMMDEIAHSGIMHKFLNQSAFDKVIYTYLSGDIPYVHLPFPLFHVHLRLIDDDFTLDSIQYMAGPYQGWNL